MLDKISGAVLIGARQRQARSQLLAAFVEQLLVDTKRARDTDAAAMNMQLVTWRDRRAANEAFVAGTGDALEDLAAAVDDESEKSMQLNLLPTVQQAITNLLTVYEPEFLRFGYGLFLSFATILIALAGHPDDVLARRPRRADVRLRQAAAVHLVRLRDDRVLRGADSGHSASRSAT